MGKSRIPRTSTERPNRASKVYSCSKVATPSYKSSKVAFMTKPSITSSILDLLTEEVKDAPRPPVTRRKIEEFPDAIVLCIVNTTCKICHTQYSHPNSNILGRYDKHYKKIEKWSSLFEQLPRERLLVPEDATSCQNCFESAVLRTEDIEGSVI